MARQTSVRWNLMIGKSPLWVAKQHDHSIATMLRAYAAWAEGAAEVDVKAIRRAMNNVAPPIASTLAVDLPVADVVSEASAPAPALPGISQIRVKTMITKQKRMTNQTDEELAGVAGFEPTNGGIKTRHNTQHNQEVTDFTDRNIPLQSLRFPIAATKPATSQSVLRRCRFAGTGINAGTRDLIAMRVHTDIRNSHDHDGKRDETDDARGVLARTRLTPDSRGCDMQRFVQ
jgi:hypothetical protein